MLKKFIAVALVCAVLCSLLAGCKKEKPVNDQEKNTSQTSTDTDVEQYDESNGDDDSDQAESLLKKFNIKLGAAEPKLPECKKRTYECVIDGEKRNGTAYTTMLKAYDQEYIRNVLKKYKYFEDNFILADYNAEMASFYRDLDPAAKQYISFMSTTGVSGRLKTSDDIASNFDNMRISTRLNTETYDTPNGFNLYLNIEKLDDYNLIYELLKNFVPDDMAKYLTYGGDDLLKMNSELTSDDGVEYQFTRELSSNSISLAIEIRAGYSISHNTVDGYFPIIKNQKYKMSDILSGKTELDFSLTNNNFLKTFSEKYRLFSDENNRYIKPSGYNIEMVKGDTGEYDESFQFRSDGFNGNSIKFQYGIREYDGQTEIYDFSIEGDLGEIESSSSSLGTLYNQFGEEAKRVIKYFINDADTSFIKSDPSDADKETIGDTYYGNFNSEENATLFGQKGTMYYSVNFSGNQNNSNGEFNIYFI